MPLNETASLQRRAEIERLIDLARGLLTSPREEIVINYLNHAVDALHIVSDEDGAQQRSERQAKFMVPAKKLE